VETKKKWQTFSMSNSPCWRALCFGW